MEEKTQITQDELYRFMQSHNLIITRLGEKIGLGIGSMSACFNHFLANGEPRYFTSQSVAKINEALPQMAFEVERRRVVFNMANNSGKQRKSFFDPGCLEQFKKVGDYFKVDAMCQRVLGWGEVKTRKVLFAPSSPMYGHIKPEDVNRLNEELMFVSFWLQRHEVVPNKCTRTRMEQSFESKAQPWDDVSLTLQERTRLVRERWPNGILFFRVNGGYTLEGDDARFAESIDGRISPYTDAASGLTTAYMDEDVLQSVLPKMVSQDKRIVFTDMY